MRRRIIRLPERHAWPLWRPGRSVTSWFQQSVAAQPWSGSEGNIVVDDPGDGAIGVVNIPVVYDLVELASGRWVLPVMAVLEPSPLRFMDLLPAVNDRMSTSWSRRLSERVLSDTLRRLEAAGLVLHQLAAGELGSPGPYELAEGARSLLAAMAVLEAWAKDNHAMVEGIRWSRRQSVGR
jgi:DNA-binding HxlR family transcriptional regulator